ncbi:hypothetical protein Tco_0232414 [Tanacetum coccineum]
MSKLKLILNHLPKRRLIPLLKARDKTSAKAAKPAKKKQHAKTSKAKGLTVISEVALTEAEQMKLATRRSLIQTHSSYASGSCADEGTGITPGVPDVPTYESDDDKISWKSSDEEDDDTVGMHDDKDDNDDDNDNDDDDDNDNDDDDENDDDDDDDDDTDNQDDDDDQEHDDQDDEGQDDVNEQTDLDNNGDAFVHPKFSTHNEEYKEENSFDPRVQTPSHVESTDDESDEEIQGANDEGEEMDEEATNEEDEGNELYRDVNINLEGRDIDMTDALLTNVQGTQVTEDTHMIITALVNPEGQQQSSSVSSGFVSNMLNPSPDTGIDSIFNINTESTSLVGVPVTTIAETPLLSATTLPPPPIPLITHPQQTPVPALATVPSSSLHDLPNFGFLLGFDHRLKALEDAFLEFKQINQFATAVSSIPGIVDTYLANKMNEAVKVTSHAVAANLSELELKKILIDKMERNKSIHRSDEQKNLYKVLVDAYESDKLILDTYGDNVSFKRHRDDEDKDEEPFVGSNQGSKRRRAGKEPESTSAPMEKTSKTTGKSTEGSKSHHKSAGKSAQAEEPLHTAKDLEEPAHQEFET